MKAKGGCYLIRAKKPGAYFGWPVISRHVAYIGETTSYYHRRNQHFYGDTRWGHAPQPWSDLEPKFYRLPTALWRYKWARLLQETMWIWLLCPVYNVKQQPPWNIRRITKAKAQRQAWKRAELGVVYRVGAPLIRKAVALIIFAGAVWSAWELGVGR